MTKRKRPDKGFYSYLHNLSTVDEEVWIRAHRSTTSTAVLSLSSDKELPEGVFLVERVIHHKQSKVLRVYLSVK